MVVPAADSSFATKSYAAAAVVSPLSDAIFATIMILLSPAQVRVRRKELIKRNNYKLSIWWAIARSQENPLTYVGMTKHGINTHRCGKIFEHL